MMRLLKIVFFFVLVQVISCLTYEQLARDECFKKVYLCGDYRMSVTDGSGRLATEPHRFSEICRKNKEFIACVEQAADFCSGKLTNVSRMVLVNRRSLKLFCTDLEWKRNYFSSAKCINENEKAIQDECIKEEDEYEDDRPYWCLIPEPCDALERVFICTVRKMKKVCGSAAAEVHRRMHILIMENRDIVCEIRQRNAVYCPHRVQKPPQSELVKRIGSLSVSLSEAINNIFETALVDTMENFALLVNEENLSNLFESDAYELRKSNFEAEIKEKFRPFFKNCKFPEDELSRQPELSTRKFNLIFRSIEKILTEASSNKLGSTFYDNLLNSRGTKSIALSSCLEKFKDFEVLKSFNPASRISYELNAELKSLKDYILGLFEHLNCNEDFLVNNISEDAAFIAWENMDSFPLQTLSCEWKYYNSFKKVFQCSLKFKPSDVTNENIQPNITQSTIVKSTIKRQNVNEFLRPFIPESSLFPDSGSGMADDFILSAATQEISPASSTADTLDYEVDPYNIHRSGQQMELQEEIDSGEVSNQESDIKLKSIDGSTESTQALSDKDQQEYSMEEIGIFVDPSYSNTDSVLYLVKDANSNTAESYLDSLESFASTFNSKSSESGIEVDNEKTRLEKENLKLQLRKIVSVLDERFSNVEAKDFEFKEGSKLDSVKRQNLENLHFQAYPHPSSSINKSFQTELNDFLKAKLYEYTEIYSVSSKSPITEDNVRGARTRRRAVNERQNSKMDKSFSAKSLNESVRPNSKFTNFKDDL